MRTIVIVAFDQALLLDVAGPLQAFDTARQLCLAQGLPDPYRLTVVSPSGGPVVTASGLAIVTEAMTSLAGKPIDTIVVAGGPGARVDRCDPSLKRWLSARARRARRVCSVCTGAFLLAEAGLLDGRRAVTHWASCALLQERYPKLRVETDPIFIRDGKVWTSAGVTAGIDLALALIEEDLGRAIALRTARQLVVFLKRPGGQSQYSAMLELQSAGDGTFDELNEWMAHHLGEDLRVERLAERAGMSARNFARLYTERNGITPAKAVERLRVEAACRALEALPTPIELIARQCGFGDEERMRRSFLRRLGVAPRHYRQRFSRSDRQLYSSSAAE
ncbi:MAG TPA: GlxA family transcriptional regulator [Stellaceae bacterium]|nr:GlxA family transcriptional regulator [Stellaceae bacterium]